MEFILNTDRTRFDFYLTLMNLGLITQTNGTFKKTRRMKSLVNKLNLPPQSPIPDRAEDFHKLGHDQMKEILKIVKDSKMDKRLENQNNSLSLDPGISTPSSLKRKHLSFRETHESIQMKNPKIHKIMESGKRFSPKGKSLSVMPSFTENPKSPTNFELIPKLAQIQKSVLTSNSNLKEKMQMMRNKKFKTISINESPPSLGKLGFI